MAAIENLEIIVNIEIAEALKDLKELQQKLQDVADDISQVDARGTEGINITTHVESIEDDLARLKMQMEGFERANTLNIGTNVRSANFPSGLGGRAVGGGGGAAVADFDMANFFDADAFDAFRQTRDITTSRDDGGGGLRRRIRNFAGGLREARENMSGFSLRMTDMHNALASLIPLLLAFIGVIPTAVAAIAALATAAITAAGALLAIGGLGLLGAAGGRGQRPSMDEISEELSEVADMFWEAFAPLAEALGPVFEDALDGVERFFEAIAAQGDALMGLVDEMRAFGGFVMDFFPSFLRTLSATLEALSPLFAEMGEFLDNEFQNIMRSLVQITLDAAPALAQLAQNLGRVAMFLAETGLGFAYATSTLMNLLSILGGFLNLLQVTDTQLGFIIGSSLIFASVLSLINTRLVQLAATGIVAAVRALQGFIFNTWMATSSVGVFSGSAIAGAITSLIGFTASLFQSIASLAGFTISAYKAAAAAATFWSVVTLGAAIPVLATIGSMASGFLGISDSVDQATKSMKEFNRVAGRTGGTDFNPYGGDSPAGTREGASGSVSGGSSGGTTINYESNNDTGDDQSNLDKTAWRASRTTGSS